MPPLENKIPPPVIAALFAAAMWVLSRYVAGVEVSGSARMVSAILILLLGVFFCLAGVVSFKRAKTTVNPLKPETASALVNSGIYRISRNPMYVGFALILFAWAAFLASPWALLGVIGFVLYMNRFQITPEERALGALFGDEFVDYRSRVRRWL
jgi:protein-S-isoprenylcysteine O-methyltransferase Ste14